MAATARNSRPRAALGKPKRGNLESIWHSGYWPALGMLANKTTDIGMEYRIKSSDDFARVTAQLHAMSFPFRVSILKGEDRTKAQNRTVHKWFGEIAAHRGDVTAQEVKAECNLAYGKSILLRDDPEWAGAWRALFAPLSHEKKLKAIRVFDIPFTRNMSVSQLTEYMEQMMRDTLSEGIAITIPESEK